MRLKVRLVIILILLISGVIIFHKGQKNNNQIKTISLSQVQQLPDKAKKIVFNQQHLIEQHQPIPNNKTVAKPAYVEWIFSVTLNQQDLKQNIFALKDEKNRVYVSEEILRNWRVKPSYPDPILYNGENFYSLDRFEQIHYDIDDHLGCLNVIISGDLFESSQFDLHQWKLVEPQSPTEIGGFLNYDLFASKVSHQTNQTSGLFEVGFFDGWGVVTSNFVVKKEHSHDQTLRLSTLLTKDFPMRMQSFRLGDTVTYPGLWGSSVSFGGIQWGTNFDTQPGFMTFPLPAMQGTAVMPSVVDIYFNNALVGKRDIAAGPFDIKNIPVTTSPGEIKLVVTDILGREQIVTVPYYMNQRILKKGLHDYSMSFGFVRKNYGLESNDYGNLIFSGTDTIGVTNRLTGQIHTEMTTYAQTLGIGGNWLVGNYGILSAAAAGSYNRDDMGGLAFLQFSYQNHHYSYGFSTKWTSSDYYGIEFNHDKRPPVLESQASLGLSLPYRTSMSVSYVGRVNREQVDQHFLTVNVNRQFKGVYVSLSAMTNIGGEENKSILLNFAIPLGERTSSYVHDTYQADHHQVVAELQHSLPPGNGYGYHIKASKNDYDYFDVGVQARGNIGTYSAEVATTEHQTAYRLNARGGIALFKGIHFMRRVNQSFAVIKSTDYTDIPIYQENHLVDKINKRGLAFVTNLRAYEENHISIHADELPIDAVVDKTEFNLIPYYRSGLVYTLPVRKAHNAIITVRDPSGEFIPMGAEAQIIGHKEKFTVGMEGMLYLTGLESKNQVLITCPEYQCRFTLDYQETDDPLPDLGEFICYQSKKYDMKRLE